jgi:hypothetical protein
MHKPSLKLGRSSTSHLQLDRRNFALVALLGGLVPPNLPSAFIKYGWKIPDQNEAAIFYNHL